MPVRSSMIASEMNRLPTEMRVQVVASLVEGNSIRATCRMTGVAKNTVVKLLTELGEACQRYQDEHLRNLPCKRVQCDEVWSFCYSKDKNVPEQHKGEFGYGDVWTWKALLRKRSLGKPRRNSSLRRLSAPRRCPHHLPPS